MIGATLMVIILVVVIPVSVFLSGMVGAAILGWALDRDSTETYEGTEFLDLA